jgi:hypothetical protein
MNNKPFAALGQHHNFIRSYSGIIFFVFVSLLLGYAIFSMSATVTTTLDQVDAPNGGTGTIFDQRTIDDVKKLQVSTDQSGGQVSLPANRPNPLVE